jgi:hypothetical protein
MYLTDSELQLGANRIVGLRFGDIPIEKDASIATAYIEFSARYTNTTTTSITIRGEATGNASVFSASNNDIGSRSKTTSSASWSVPSWVESTMQRRIEVAQAALRELVEDKTISWGFGTWHDGFSSTIDYTRVNVGCKYQ